MTTPRIPISLYCPGILLSGAIAGLAMASAFVPAVQQWGLGALTLAILAGILLGTTVFPRIAPACGPGVDFCRSMLLRLGIILYGFRISFQQIADVGWAGMMIDMLVIGCTFTLAVQLGTRLFNIDRQTAMLIGAGSSICGAAAVMAAEPVVQGQAHKVSVAVATVVVFGTLAMFAYPLAYPYLDLSEAGYGLFVGSTIHEVAQVVAASKAVGEQAAATAVIEKMLRVMMLAPFLLILSKRTVDEDNTSTACGRITVPWFALLFIAASGVNSLHLLPAALVDMIVQADSVLLAMAMAALGLRTHAGAVRQAGIRPILLAGTLFAFLFVGGYFINRMVTAVFS